MANQKIRKSLEEIAKINNIEVKTVSPTQGYLTGYSPHFDTTAIVIYSPKNGIQIWYKHEGDCSKCSRTKECRETILEEARDRKLVFEGDVNRMSPSKLAEGLFSVITGENRNGEEKA